MQFMRLKLNSFRKLDIYMGLMGQIYVDMDMGMWYVHVLYVYMYVYVMYICEVEICWYAFSNEQLEFRLYELIFKFS